MIKRKNELQCKTYKIATTEALLLRPSADDICSNLQLYLKLKDKMCNYFKWNMSYIDNMWSNYFILWSTFANVCVFIYFYDAKPLLMESKQ